MKRIAALAVLLLVAACSLAPGGSQAERAVAAAINEGITERKAYNDKKAATLLALPCDISVGAYYRIENTVQQEALTMLCSGKRPWEPSPALALGTSAVPPPAPGAQP